jgi:hypothetical protein
VVPFVSSLLFTLWNVSSSTFLLTGPNTLSKRPENSCHRTGSFPCFLGVPQTLVHPTTNRQSIILMFTIFSQLFLECCVWVCLVGFGWFQKTGSLSSCYSLLFAPMLLPHCLLPALQRGARFLGLRCSLRTA